MKLKERQIALIKGMLARGDRQHDIAALFGVNGGRVAEVANGKVGKDIEAATGRLPPVRFSPYEVRQVLAVAVADLSVALSRLSPSSPPGDAVLTLIDGVRANLSAALAGELPKQRNPT